MIIKIVALSIAAIAAYMDIRFTRVKNALIIFGIAAGLAFRIFFAGGWTENYASPLSFLLRPKADIYVLLEGIAGMAVPFALLYFFYLQKLIGAGDIKLFCVLGLYMGPMSVLFCMLAAFAAACLVSLVRIIIRRSVKEVLRERVHVAVYIFISTVFWAKGVW